MKTSLLYKIIIGYFIFAIIGFTSIQYGVTSIVYNDYVSKKSNELSNYTTQVANYVENNFDEKNRKMKLPSKYYLRITSVLQCNLTIIDKHHRIIYTSLKNKINAYNSLKKFKPSYYTGDKNKIDNFYDIFPTDTLTVITPVKKNKTVIGYVAAHTATSDIKNKSMDVTSFVYLFFLLIFIVALIFLLILIISIFKPMVSIKKAAMEYAKGNFEYDQLNLNKSNEIGDLANSLTYMAEQLKNSRDYQETFISNISHDFRSPLTSIKGYLSAMKDGVIEPADYNKYLDILIAESNRLEKLTDGLRELNKWSAGMTIDFKPFDMENVITNTVATFSGKCDEKNIQLIIQFPQKHINVIADQIKIEQVFYNLLDNAIKFSHNNSRIIIKLSNKGKKQYCSIKDFGQGIPADSLNKIWQRFYKTDASRGKDKTGSGIGLAIVKDIIIAHNETIDVISTEGVGTEFIFSLKQFR